MKSTLKYSRLSWEPELFISGGLIFTLFQAPNWLAQIKVQAEALNEVLGLNELILILALALSVVTAGFIIHLLFKALWVGMKAFEYSMGDKINIENLKINSRFHSSLILEFTKSTDGINKLSGLIFGTSIFLLFSLLGIAFYQFIFIYFIYSFNLPGNILWLVQIPLIIYIFDGVFFNILKKNSFISKIYYPIYTFMSFLTFSVFYRGMYYSLVSNNKLSRILILVGLLLFLSYPLTKRNISRALLTGGLINEDYQFWEFSYGSDFSKTNNYYLDSYTQDHYIVNAAIQSHYIDKDLLILHLRQKKIDHLFTNISISDKKINFQEIINKKITLKIDNNPVVGNWNFNYYNPTQQYTLMNELPIYHLAKGMHYLQILVPDQKNRSLRQLKIPFWKE